MRRTQRCFRASGCSTYSSLRLRAPQVENPTEYGASPSSRQNPVRYAGLSYTPMFYASRLERFAAAGRPPTR